MDVATPTTLSAPTPTPPAATATGSPSESIAPSQRPTFDQAFAADAAPITPDPSTDPGTPAIPAADGTAPPSATHPSTKEGPIPFAVHKTALDNARLKAGEDAVAQYRQQYGWAEQVPRETIQEWSGIARQMASDPPAFLEKYFADAATDPTHGAAVRSWAARTLATRAPKAVDLSPDVTVQDDQGREVARTFSADRVQAIVQHAVQEAIGKEVAPLKQDHAQRQAADQRQAAERRQAETRQQLEASTDAVLADLAELLDVTAETPTAQAKALYDEVETLLAADPTLSPHKAAMQVRKARIVPALAGKAQKSVLDDLNKRAASQGINPAAAAIAPTHRPRSFEDPSLQW